MRFTRKWDYQVGRKHGYKKNVTDALARTLWRSLRLRQRLGSSTLCCETYEEKQKNRVEGYHDNAKCMTFGKCEPSPWHKMVRYRACATQWATRLPKIVSQRFRGLTCTCILCHDRHDHDESDFWCHLTLHLTKARSFQNHNAAAAPELCLWFRSVNVLLEDVQ